MLDAGANKIEQLDNVQALESIEDLWLNENLMENLEQLNNLTNLENLETLYLEHNPMAKEFEYRKIVANSIPQLVQLDATNIIRS